MLSSRWRIQISTIAMLGTPAPNEVQIFKSVKAGENIRPRGMDIHAGEIVLHKGTHS